MKTLDTQPNGEKNGKEPNANNAPKHVHAERLREGSGLSLGLLLQIRHTTQVLQTIDSQGDSQEEQARNELRSNLKTLDTQPNGNDNEVYSFACFVVLWVSNRKRVYDAMQF